MSFTFDTIVKTIPAEQALKLTAEQKEEKDKQDHVWSLHPQCPQGVRYVGTELGNFGYANDYYIDTEGTYWHESRLADSPVVTQFIYGGQRCKRYTASARAAGRKHMSA